MAPGRTRLAWWPWRFPFDRARRTPNVSTPCRIDTGYYSMRNGQLSFLPKAERPQNEALPSDFPVYRIGFLVPSSEIGSSPADSAPAPAWAIPAARHHIALPQRSTRGLLMSVTGLGRVKTT